MAGENYLFSYFKQKSTKNNIGRQEIKSTNEIPQPRFFKIVTRGHEVNYERVDEDYYSHRLYEAASITCALRLSS